jgi:thymidylate kinase
MKIITLSGPDGSGKSTQATMLEEYFATQGLKVVRFHAVQFSLINRLFRTYSDVMRDPEDQPRAVTEGNFLSAFIRKVMFVIDVYRFRYFAKKIAFDTDILISDRFYHDTLVNIAYIENKFSFRFLLLEKILPLPDVAFYFNISPAEIMRRDRAPEQGAAYLDHKRALYESKIAAWNLRVINAARSREQVFENVVTLLPVAR